MATSSLAKAFYDKGKVILVEPLGSTLRLGSIGYFSAGQWVEVATTKSMFGLRLSANPGSSQPNSYDGKGGKGFSFAVKAKGEVSELVPNLADAKLRAEVSFGSTDGFVMSVRNQRVETAQELAEIMSAIRWAYHFRDELPEGRRWEKKYAVIVGVAKAESVTAVAASSSKAAIVVEGSAKLPAPATPAELDAKMKITRTTESTETLWRGPADGYGVQALRLDPSIWTGWESEDLKYLRRLVGRGTPPSSARSKNQVPRRPGSFVEWAKSEGLASPAKAAVTLVRASGRAGTRGTAAQVLKQV
jgi:hypothetical protein